MQTIQVVALPPNHGRIYLASIGWTWNRRKPATPRVVAKRTRMACVPIVMRPVH